MTEPILNDKFTYQDKPLSDRLEKYEWDRMWIEDTTDKDSKRIDLGKDLSARDRGVGQEHYFQQLCDLEGTR